MVVCLIEVIGWGVRSSKTILTFNSVVMKLGGTVHFAASSLCREIIFSFYISLSCRRLSKLSKII